jgi:integrase
MTVCAVLPFDRPGRACVSARLGDHDKQRAPRTCHAAQLHSRAPGATAGFSASIVARLVNRRLAAGKKGGRAMPLNKELRAAVIALKSTRNGVEATDRVIHDKRDLHVTGCRKGVVSSALRVGFAGASSHSGRRTFVTRCAKNIIAAGVSLQDVQELDGHSSLATTQRYIQGDTETKA